MNSLEARTLRLVMERDLNDQRPFLVAELAVKWGSRCRTSGAPSAKSWTACRRRGSSFLWNNGAG